MKALSDYVHGKGLKLGIYSDAGYAQLTKRKKMSQEKNIIALSCGFLSPITLTFLLLVHKLAAKRCRVPLDTKSKTQKPLHLG